MFTAKRVILQNILCRHTCSADSLPGAHNCCQITRSISQKGSGCWMRGRLAGNRLHTASHNQILQPLSGSSLARKHASQDLLDNLVPKPGPPAESVSAENDSGRSAADLGVLTTHLVSPLQVLRLSVDSCWLSRIFAQTFHLCFFIFKRVTKFGGSSNFRGAYDYKNDMQHILLILSYRIWQSFLSGYIPEEIDRWLIS